VLQSSRVPGLQSSRVPGYNQISGEVVSQVSVSKGNSGCRSGFKGLFASTAIVNKS
jgi:hypothetical protein